MVFEKKRVLIVEDEHDLLDIYNDAFDDNDIEVHVAENGLKALELVQGTKFDAIVTDLKMPHIHGLQLIACIKVSELNKNCKILVISSNLHNENLRKLEGLNAVETMSKPVIADDLKLRVEQLIYPERKEAVAYNPKYIGVFKEAMCKVLSFYFDEKPDCADPYIQRSAEPYGIVSGVVNFFGPEFFGVLSISCDGDFIRNLSANLFDLNPLEVDPEQHKDLIGEMANQIGGAVKAIVAESHHKDTLLGIPYVLENPGEKIPACVSSPKIAVLFSVGNGNCRLEFALGDPQHLHVNKGGDVTDIFIYKKKAA